MFGNIILVIAYLVLPAGVLWLCRRVKFLGKLGPILILYLIGILIGNVFHTPAMAQIQDALSNSTIPLAIPLMLFGCTFRKSETRSQFLALLTGLVSVAIAVIAGYFVFGKSIQDGAKIGGMLTGVYTGGTMNMASLKSMLGVSDEVFVLLNSYDMVVCFLYLTFLMVVGIKFFRKFLPCSTLSDAYQVSERTQLSSLDSAATDFSKNPYKGLLTGKGLGNAAVLIGITVLEIGISAGIAALIGHGLFMTIFFLLLTTLGIASSFIKSIHNRPQSYELGMYLIYIFSLVVSSMADFSKIDLSNGLNLLGYLSLVIFGSLAIQIVFAKIFRIDSDTMVISSVTYICSPPFVPMICASMRNRNVLAAGLAIGIVGYAAGNYLGFAIFKLLSFF